MFQHLFNIIMASFPPTANLTATSQQNHTIQQIGRQGFQHANYQILSFGANHVFWFVRVFFASYKRKSGPDETKFPKSARTFKEFIRFRTESTPVIEFISWNAGFRRITRVRLLVLFQ